jgi:nucleoside-diphosphate-sugar epimerase
MKALVTGGAGFIGTALVKRLLAQGIEVRCLVHRSAGLLEGLGVELVRGDLLDPQALDAACRGRELVFHLAGTGRAGDWGEREWFFRINAQGTAYLLQAAARAGVRRLVHLSSLAVHRFTGHVDADENVPADQQRHAYGASKARAEQYVLEYGREGRLEVVAVRPGVVVYGEHDYTSLIYMAPLLEKGFWPHVNGGRPLMCSVYVGNLAEGLWLCASRPEAAGEIFIVTDDRRISWREFISAFTRAFGARERTISFPGWLARPIGVGLEKLFRAVRSRRPPPITDYRTDLVCRDMHFVCEKAKRLLGYRPVIEMEEGLRRAAAWWIDSKSYLAAGNSRR